VRIATGDLTAPVMYRHDGQYYLFAAYGRCCPPLDGSRPPTSNIRVGRATAPTGPFHAGDGAAMLQGGATTILAAHAHVRGPGGPDVVFDTRDDTALLAYHWYDSRLNHTSFLGINNLRWENGWPVVE
jgi:arabinan endo-1,5-alpha-L-arabinosidase